MKILITGISGSGGSYLAEHIVAHEPGVEVHGLARWHTSNDQVPPNLRSIIGKVRVHECDLLDFSSIVRVLNEVKPARVFHLASHANVRASFSTPLAVVQNNVMGTMNLFEAVRTAGIDPVIQLCSTSEVYGQVSREHVPIREDAPFKPASPYAVSKATQDLLGYSYYQSYHLKIVRTRMFAYLNPKRSDLFATSFALQVARIEKGLQTELKHGNLDSVRTFIDVRDAMEAYWVAAEKCAPGEAYNIGGTTTKTVGEFLEILKSKARVKFTTREDPALLRPSDVTLQIPDTSKFERATGWRPRYSFEESVDNLLTHCRSVVSETFRHLIRLRSDSF